MRRSLLLLLALLLLAPAPLPAASSDAPSKKVEVFVTDWCGYCRKLESFLKKNNIEFTRYNVEKDIKGKLLYSQIKGANGVPVTRIGDEIVYGYDPDAILAAVNG